MSPGCRFEQRSSGVDSDAVLVLTPQPTATDRAADGSTRFVHIEPAIATFYADDVEPYRRELLLHCYRMLGSHRDAEDVVQEVMIAAWRGLSGFEARSSLRTWLYRIATNRCLNVRRTRSRRPATTQLPFDPPAPTRRDGAWWLEPLHDARLPATANSADDIACRADIALGFVAALQALPGRQAAALLLHDVIGFDRAEVAALLDTTPTSVKGLLQRARAATPAAAATDAPHDPDVEQELVDAFVDALHTGDVGALVALLTSDAVLSMPPLDLVYEGRPAIAAFRRASTGWLPERRVSVVRLRCNGAPAFVHTIDGAGRGGHEDGSTGLVVIEIREAGIARITRFLDPQVVERARTAPKRLRDDSGPHPEPT